MIDITSSGEDPADIETLHVGFFRFRAARGAPWQAVRVIRESGCWVVLLNGQPVAGSGARLARDIPFVLWRAPFHPVSEADYDALLRAYERAPPGSPLRSPDQPVDLRAAPALYRGRNA